MAKLIRDVVYGYLSLDDSFVRIIDTPHFQRLKRIRQVTSQDVYPSTNHTRFEHSLGVLALGRKALSAIEDNLDDPALKGQIQDLRPTIETALLLHDVGHAPFSHLCEKYYDTNAVIRLLAKDYGIQLTDQCAPHEAMSALISVACFEGELRDAGVDCELLCRMITGQAYDQPAEWVKNAAIQMLSSPSDIDKLDYVVRDNFMTGGQLAAFDHERITFSYRVNEKTLVFAGKALSAVTNMVHGRDLMYTWVYNHHTTVYTNHLVTVFMDHLLETSQVNHEALFSFEAVTDRLTDDCDILCAMKDNKDTDERCSVLFEQLFHRKHHKALWKTWCEFTAVVPDDSVRDRIITFGDQPERLANMLRQGIGNVSKDQLYVAKAVFKPFTPVAAENIYLETPQGNRQFTQFFHPSATRGVPPEIPYVFLDPETVDEEAVANAANAL